MIETEKTSENVVFPLIADAAAYQPSTIDLLRDSRAREVWLSIFERHTPGLEKLARLSQGDTPGARRRASEMSAGFLKVLADYRKNPTAHGHPSVIRFCSLRQAWLERYGFDDPYKPIKQAENEAAMKLLPPLLHELDAMEETHRLRALIENIFAGNIFDLGCAGTTAMYESGEADFHRVRTRLPARPWCVDDFDRLARRFTAVLHEKAVVFVDNAGADVLLGMVPFARHLLQRGTRVVLTANTNPALNDITHAELVPLIGRIAGFDGVYRRALDSGRLELVPSGNGIPLIDLSRVGMELARASEGADLLVLEGMGRSLESNYRVRFKADTLKVAMVKEQHVAETIGTKLYGVVCRFEPQD